jgi:acyl dehydratase
MESLAATRGYVGIEVGPSEWVAIDAERVRSFLAATGGDGPAASADAEGDAPGVLLLALVPNLLPALIELVGWTRGVNAGVDDCRFPVPLPVGSRVRMRAQLKRARGVPGGGVRLSFEVRFELQGQDTPACIALVHYAYFP